MTPRDYLDTAAQVLGMCRKLDKSFPKPDPEMTKAWAVMFSRRPYAPAVYFEAVQDYYEHNEDGRSPGIGQIIASARRVVERWESDPRYRPVLQAHREQRRVERDRQIAAGTFRGSHAIEAKPDEGIGGVLSVE